MRNNLTAARPPIHANFSRAGLLSDGQLWQAADYVRLSKDDGDKEESDSVVNQKELIASFVSRQKDIELAGPSYVDDGFSGVNFDRPGFQRLLEDIKSGRINCVIVKDLSRLGRNYIETGKLIEHFFPYMGVRFIAINDNYDSQRHNSQTDDLIVPFKNLINDATSADTSRKIRSQFEVKRQKGECIAPFAAFGYRKDPEDHNRLLVDETAAEVVRDIFKWKIEGMSQQGIADRLNGMGVPSPLEYKKNSGSNFRTTFQKNHKTKWTPVSVGRILKNDLYIGVLTQGKSTSPNYKVRERSFKPAEEWVRVEQNHEAIIKEADFRLVASLLKKDTRIGSGEDAVYLFSGMLVCGDCGETLIRKYVPGKDGVKYVYHVCNTHKKGAGCTSHSISDKALHEAVFHTIAAHIEACEKIGKVLAAIEDMPFQQMDALKIQKQIAEREAELEKLAGRKLRLHENFDDGLISKDDYISFRAAFNQQVEDAEQALVNLNQELSDIVNNREAGTLWIEHFKKYHNIQSLTRAAVVELIERIVVFEKGRIEVIPRYKNNYENALRYISALPADERQVG
ncbi:recombinase family protein [Ohessyouella blattaphilus]|uniref:Recombinase family protein n=1 Tax=Ohessyouella blattaphilus TaxID=2949333 RepID=A0ABT1EGW1_9FIRM|nr:recombinase family protein [Ohessyouella blattaphilus]MCP1109729.1 recombinase family protein [Ohessyouella blattaphilus]MCR8563123.1 recombinase family protein [Ohessyouella blattaphilus]